MPNINYAMMNECERAGIAGNCGTENCPALIAGECEEQNEFDPELLIELGVIEEPNYQEIQEIWKARKAFRERTEADDDYDRAMSIL